MSVRSPPCSVLICSREFGHRVKGISLSKFTPEEVEALTTGGNAVRGRGVWELWLGL